MLTLLCVDVGPTASWGYPLSSANTSTFADYSNAIENTGETQFDVVLVR